MTTSWTELAGLIFITAIIAASTGGRVIMTVSEDAILFEVRK